jgi:signal transduction histidine kinase
MRLSEFLRQSSDLIVEHSVEFARSLEPLSNPTINTAVLRNHLPLVLEAIAADLDQPQSRAAGILKSEGRAVHLDDESAAEIHGRMRAEIGLSIAEVVAEYRVLRAVVIRLWVDGQQALKEEDIPDLIRFNEAIDQAITESVAFHTLAVARWRDMMLAVVSHDLRGPVQAILSTSQVLSSKAAELYAPYVGAITRSVHRLTGLLDSLLDYSKVRLGEGLPLERRLVDLAAACESELELLRAVLPAKIEFSATGPTIGQFDAGRVREALANLVSNAVQYRLPDSVIRVIIEGSADSVYLAVINEGEVIAPEVLRTLFEPLRQREKGPNAAARRNLGIGLFVVREIAKAHGGDVAAVASNGEITFSMLLPRQMT